MARRQLTESSLNIWSTY